MSALITLSKNTKMDKKPETFLVYNTCIIWPHCSTSIESLVKSLVTFKMVTLPS